ncbi:porin [Pantoea sp. 18069]|uniref:porin n=1 Tax=Pantoea sp. 18069 TaxID=2681415 RepID=UPI00135BD143|nr:porin [Pantoea sp. 18069]
MTSPIAHARTAKTAGSRPSPVRVVHAIAVYATLTATAALAQGSVTISGKVEASVDYLRIASPTGASRTHTGLSSDSSRLIFEGVEDLGGGWSAKFKLDHGFNVDTGATGFGGAFFGREAMVGLATPYGEFRLGRNYIPMDDLTAPLDPFYFSGIGAAWPMAIFTPRINNSAKYISPRMGGFQARALASASEGVAGAQYIGLGASYSDQRVDVHAAYTRQKNALPAGDRKEFMLGGDYKFGGPRLTGFYIQRDDPGQPRRSTALVGTNWPVGSGEVRASYLLERQGSARASRAVLQYMHFLSKRTSVFAGIARLNNNAGFSETLNPALPVLTRGEDVTGTQFGIRHTF